MATRSIRYHCEFIRKDNTEFYIAENKLSKLFERAKSIGAIKITSFLFNSRELNQKKDFYNLKYFNVKELK